MRPSDPGGCGGRPAHRGRVRRLPLPAARRWKTPRGASGPWRASCPGRELQGRAAGPLRLRHPYGARRTACSSGPGSSSPCTSSTTGTPRTTATALTASQGQWQAGWACGFAQRASLCGVPASVLGGYARWPERFVGRGSNTYQEAGNEAVYDRQQHSEPLLRGHHRRRTRPPARPLMRQWDSLAKPLGGPGRAGDRAWSGSRPSPGSADAVTFPRRAVLVLCADNGVVAQGVSPDGPGASPRAVAREPGRAADLSVCQYGQHRAAARWCRWTWAWPGTCPPACGAAPRRRWQRHRRLVPRGRPCAGSRPCEAVAHGHCAGAGAEGAGRHPAGHRARWASATPPPPARWPAVLLGQPAEAHDRPGRGPLG